MYSLASEYCLMTSACSTSYGQLIFSVQVVTAGEGCSLVKLLANCGHKESPRSAEVQGHWCRKKAGVGLPASHRFEVTPHAFKDIVRDIDPNGFTWL